LKIRGGNKKQYLAPPPEDKEREKKTVTSPLSLKIRGGKKNST
jgi:hypothetical protein